MPTAEPTKILLSFTDLRALGFRWSRKHVRHLVVEGKFPAPLKLGENTAVWRSEDIANFIESRPLADRTVKPRRR